MKVKYYKHIDLSYANRKRFINFNFSPFYEEEQKSILLGDGANTSIKTKKSNICDYVTIDDTRWFVTSYVYCNGGQVTLNLQRDVIGEMGLKDCFGKIERGYTNSILKNRKELGLNQVLKERKKIIPSSNRYGSYYVDNHKNEMWGILYVVKPTDGSSSVNINIPAFNPKVVDYDFIEDGERRVKSFGIGSHISFRVGFKNTSYVFRIRIDFFYNAKSLQSSGWDYYGTCERDSLGNPNIILDFEYAGGKPASERVHTDSDYKNIAASFIYFIGHSVLDNQSGHFKLPVVNEEIGVFKEYDGVTIKKDDVYYNYTAKDETDYKYGVCTSDKAAFVKYFLVGLTDYKRYSYTHSSGLNFEIILRTSSAENTESDLSFISYESQLRVIYTKYNYKIVEPSNAGQAVIDITQQLVDEPFVVVVCPLYNVNITGKEDFEIKKAEAFRVFNTVIQSLSGESGYIVDAQIYPYCPVLTEVSFKISGLPFFSINSTTYNHECCVDLRPNADVKKEYIERTYSLISPEKSGKFDFNFYDYKTVINEYNGINTESLKIIVKTALKPFSIISSAVIYPDDDSIKGMTYESDLRGCQPTGNGFQCSLASNAFETYKRQNSNYQQIFALQREELSTFHDTERVNEKTNGVISTITAGLMGTMAGAAAADGFWGDFVHSQAIGAGVAGTTATAAVAATQAIQYSQNEKLREFEVRQQQQMFDLEIGTIKNLPNSVNRISSFNEIILKDFYYVVEIYECTEYEKTIVDNFISNYSYGIGVFDFISNYVKNSWFIRSTLVKSMFPPNLHNIAANELMGGIYIYE